MKTEPTKPWYPSESLDLAAVGLREASSQADLQGFKPIRGKGPVAANLATLGWQLVRTTLPAP